MEHGTGDRGVSEVMGFILVFGMLVLSFTVYQGLVVPDQNRQVEFQHNQDVQGQLQNLRNAIVSTAATGSGQAVSVTLGASYPKRAIAQNLGISGGSIQTTDASTIRIDNVEALDEETKDYLNGSVGPFETKSITYHPTYSFYSGAPETVYENSLAYNRFGDANLTITDQLVIDGRRITLIAINGSLSEAQRDTVSVSTEAISTSSNRVAVRNSTGKALNFTIPTRLSAAEWEEILADEMGGDGKVEDVNDVSGRNAVNISMKPGVYDLRMAKIGVGDLTAEEQPKYITDVEGDGVGVSENGTQKLVVEVRDRFNNPVSNVTVSNNSGTPDLGSLTSTTETTDSDGRASFTYNAPEDVDGTDDVNVEFSFEGDGTVNETNVTFELKVLDSDGSGGGGGVDDVNPAGQDKLVLRQSDGANNEDADLRFENTGDSDVTITAIRVPFYFSDSQDQADTVESFAGVGSFNGSNTLDVGAPLTKLDDNVTFTPGERTITIRFSPNQVQTRGDFFILVAQTESGNTITYFVAPQE